MSCYTSARAQLKARLSHLIYNKRGVTQSQLFDEVQAVLDDISLPGWYLTNHQLPSELGLDTGKTIYISAAENLSPFDILGYVICFNRQFNPIVKANLSLLQMLDVTELFSKMMEQQLCHSILLYSRLVKKLNGPLREVLVDLSLRYSHFTRAVVASSCEIIEEEALALKIWGTFIPVTFRKYKNKLKPLQSEERFLHFAV